MQRSMAFAAIVFSATIAFSADNTPPAGFTALFNGQDLTGWYGLPHFDPRKSMTYPEFVELFPKHQSEFLEHWTVDNGELVNDGKGPYATTLKQFSDIELHIAYKTVPLADSGIYLRANPQVQIWDWHQEFDPKRPTRKPHLGSGGLFNNTPDTPGRDPASLADKPLGEWNEFRITQTGARTSVLFNDQLVVDHALMENFWDRKSPLFLRGPIQLQTHGGEIRWKNIYAKELSAEESNQILVSHNADGFMSLFNGENLDGWAGDVDSFEVVNGAIRCKAGKGGNLFTKAEYSDFVARLEFKLPPAGNNGLAIRYPGEGQPYLTGMCELQVIDSEHKQYASLDARQYHGSAYGMVPAVRGYLRPTGQWNFQEVTVKGSTVKVELNGTVILDADLATVTEFKDNTPHPGKDRTTGFFGFAGHNDPVEFRNVSIKTLSTPEAAGGN
jgi:hypothetical protein